MWHKPAPRSAIVVGVCLGIINILLLYLLDVCAYYLVDSAAAIPKPNPIYAVSAGYCCRSQIIPAINDALYKTETFNINVFIEITFLYFNSIQ